MTQTISIKEKLHFDALVKGEKGFLILKPDRRIYEDDTIVLQCSVVEHEVQTAVIAPGEKAPEPVIKSQEDYECYFTAVELATDDELPGLKAGWQAISLKKKEV